MTSKLGGRERKDAEITDNFNVKKARGYSPTNDDIAKARIQNQIEADEVRLLSRLKPVAEPAAEPAVVNVTTAEKPAEVAKSTPAKTDDDADPDVKNAYQMLQDMRWVYKKCKGRSKLKEMMQDDKQFANLAKELLKVETALLTARIRAKTDSESNSGRQSFFVVLKGLEQEKPLVQAMAASGAIDMKQIQRALDPSSVSRYEAEEEKSSRERPEEILKVARTVDDDPKEETSPVETPITVQDVEGW